MIEQRCAAFIFARLGAVLLGAMLLAAMSLATVPVHAQPGEDVGTLTKQVEQLVQKGNHSEAIPIARRALAAAERQFGPDHLNVSFHLNNLAWLYQYQGQYDQAQPRGRSNPRKPVVAALCGANGA